MARELAEQLLTLAQATSDAMLFLEAHMSLGAVLVPLGEFTAALDHLEQGFAYHDHAACPPLPDISHPALGCLFYSGFALWYLGYPDQARKRIQAGLALAQQLVYPHPLVWAQHLGATFYQLCRDVGRMRELADAVVLGAARQSLQICRIEGMVVQGWASVQGGQEEAGMALIQQGLIECRSRGAGASLPRYCALLAETYRRLGRITTGLTVLTEAQTFIAQHGERAYAAELWRLQGELLLAQDDQRHTAKLAGRTQVEAETCFQQAVDIARSQQAKVLELRAAMGLSRLWRRQGEHAAAHALLATAYNWFTEGFDTADLQEAEKLLEVLEP